MYFAWIFLWIVLTVILRAGLQWKLPDLLKNVMSPKRASELGDVFAVVSILVLIIVGFSSGIEWRPDGKEGFEVLSQKEKDKAEEQRKNKKKNVVVQARQDKVNALKVMNEIRTKANIGRK